MAQPARYFWLLAGTSLCNACAGSGGAAPAALSTAQVVSSGAPTQLATRPPSSKAKPSDEPRLFPPFDLAGTTIAGEGRDGSRRVIAYGLRILQRPDGSRELSREYLPTARRVRSLELPARLGAGFLFYVPTSGATLLYRAATFTGDLEPLARLDFEADQVVAGFDRVYVVANRPDRIVALDAEHGTALGLGSLPTSPSFGKMAFVDAWFGAVQVPLRGTLVTFDAGASWRPLGFVAATLDVRDSALRMVTADGVLDLDQNGVFTRRDIDAAAAVPRENAVAQALRSSDAVRDGARPARERLGESALKLAVLRGFRDSDGTLLVADAGMLLRVRASDGKLLDSNEHAYPGGGECTALTVGQGHGFSCNDGQNQTTLYGFRPPFALQRMRSFQGARYVAASGTGGLVIRGTCNAGAVKDATPGAYCVASRAGEFREIRVRGDLGVERVVALADGRVAVIVPPRLGAAGFLSLIDVSGREQRVALKLPTSVADAALLEKGLWLDGFIERKAGVLAGWVVAAEPFAGVRVALDGKVTIGRPEMSIDRALLSGSRALLVGRTGRAHESSDGGFEWSDVQLPPEFDAAREPKEEARLQGCSDLGCAFGGFVRVGWGSTSASPRLAVAPLPEPTPLPQPGGSRWVLRCVATGESSEPMLPAPVRSLRAQPREQEGEVAPWSPFFELPAPALAAGEVGYDTASAETDAAAFHAYTWGERGADWARAGHFQLRALDRFRVQGAAFQSAVTRSPWADATSAAEAFGFDAGVANSPPSFRAIVEAGGRAGAVVASSPGRGGVVDLLLFEQGKTLSRLPNIARLGGPSFGMLSTVAKLSDAWYGGSFNESHAFTLSKIASGRVARLAEYPDPGRDISTATLVRGVRGEELGVWVTGRGWYLFPIDSASHALLAPLYQSPANLAELPPLCAADADGFLLSGAPTLEPSLRFERTTDDIRAHRVEVQFVWSARGLCTLALAAETETPIKRSTGNVAASNAANSSLAVPLALSERRPQGRRLGYSCVP